MADRDAILEGTQAAQRLHARLGTKAAFEKEALSRVDIFAATMQMGAKLLFRPLQGLVGAYLGKPMFPVPGIIVSTLRDLHVQRFTAAHELGHLYLQHKPSLDEHVGLWRGGVTDPQEVAAEAFASEFLLPRWLYIHHAKRHSWDSAALRRPEITYQLSLRLGASYDATCWGLRGHDILPKSEVEKLREHKPKALKQLALGGWAELSNPWADVWVIDEADDGLSFDGGPDDIVIFRCRESASGGYLWNESTLQQQGLEVLADGREESQGEEYGGAVTRVLVTRATEAREYRVSLSERRPWQPDDSMSTLTVSLDLRGKEVGLPRLVRKAMASV